MSHHDAMLIPFYIHGKKDLLRNNHCLTPFLREKGIQQNKIHNMYYNQIVIKINSHQI